MAVIVGLATTSIGLWSVLTAADADPRPIGDDDRVVTTVPVATTPTTLAAAPPVAATAQCANTTFGFALSYPGDWVTSALDDSEACRFFHPEPFEIPPGAFLPETAIRVEDLAVDFDGWVASYDEPFLVVHEREETVVAGGARAVRFLFSFADDPAGVLSESYIVDRGVGVLALETHSPFAPDFDEARTVLVGMVASLEFFG